MKRSVKQDEESEETRLDEEPPKMLWHLLHSLSTRPPASNNFLVTATVAASHFPRQSDTHRNTANYTSEHHTMVPVMSIMGSSKCGTGSIQLKLGTCTVTAENTKAVPTSFQMDSGGKRNDYEMQHSLLEIEMTY